jgi:hypothetical protein
VANKRGQPRRKDRNRRAAALAAKRAKQAVAGKSAGTGKTVNAPKGIW